MPESKLMIILANSARPGGMICVAGKELAPAEKGLLRIGSWIRVAHPEQPQGALPLAATRYLKHGSAQLLDVARIPLTGHCGNADHPEDWWLNPRQPWEFVRKHPIQALPTLADNPVSLWHEGDEDKSVPAGYVRRMDKTAATLYLIKAPKGWTFTYGKEWNKQEQKEKVYRRLAFEYAGVQHEFSVTDRLFTTRYQVFERAQSNPQTLTIPNPEAAYFCLSLTQELPGHGKQYKICATIFERR
ncbi:MAG: hypothetical protein C5B50_00400 [Verrucomicrobia bacterium]|nr:MAG: hypothetical protein C5B50_00400 [Verrucomicrobiota bacterium]